MEQSVCAVASVHVRIFATPGTVAHQAALSMGFSRQQYWSGLPCPPPGDLPNPGVKPRSLMSSALAGGFFTTSATWEAPRHLSPHHLTSAFRGCLSAHFLGHMSIPTNRDTFLCKIHEKTSPAQTHSLPLNPPHPKIPNPTNQPPATHSWKLRNMDAKERNATKGNIRNGVKAERRGSRQTGQGRDRHTNKPTGVEGRERA